MYIMIMSDILAALHCVLPTQDKHYNIVGNFLYWVCNYIGIL